MTIIELPTQKAGSQIHAIPLSEVRIGRAKRAYSTHIADLARARRLLIGERAPRAGDLVLVRVNRIGQHRRIELPCGRRAHLHVGDELILCYGGRYAPDQFEGVVPEDLGPCQLLAAGGIAGLCRQRHKSMKAPTQIEPVGLLADEAGRVINLREFACQTAWAGPQPRVHVVVGSSMNAGKTTTAGMLVRGLGGKGLRVGSAKVTGTGAGCDRWFMLDAGADPAIDFTDLGVPSTYGLGTSEILALVRESIGRLGQLGCDEIVLEVADGLFQRETAALLASREFRQLVGQLWFAAADAMGAVAGVAELRRLGYPVRGVSGAVTASPLAAAEAQAALSVPVVTAEALAAGQLPPAEENEDAHEHAARIF